MSSSSSRSSRLSAPTGRGGLGVEGMSSPVPYRVGPLAYEPAVMCWCNRKAPCWISWSDANPGRRYYRCPAARTAGDCGFYRWIEVQHSPFMKDLLVDLRDAVWDLKRENGQLKHLMEQEKREQEEQLAVLKAKHRKEVEEKDAALLAMSAKINVGNRCRSFGLMIGVFVVGLFVAMVLGSMRGALKTGTGCCTDLSFCLA